MPRPRIADDEELLSAAGAVLSTSGPSRFTLQRVADRADVSAATLIKRFGSKRELMLAMNRRWVASIRPGMAEATAGHDTALQRLRAAALWGFADLDNAANTARQLASLAVDLQDDDMRALLARGWRVVRRRLTELADDAIDTGDLDAAPPAEQAARILFALGEGTRLAWSVEPRGSLVARASADLDAVLAAWGTQR
ncbi:MAG: TetR family transcriptional regulator [Pseudonocardiales bacterium]|nr:MAG: TetR family transcriptional regulator [Pseudonocardiales bacterium]